MIKTKIVKIKQETTTDVICDSCGKSCKVFLGENKKHFNFEYMRLSARWGYGSDKDLEVWEAHICEKCVDTKFTKITFKKEHYNIHGHQ